MCAKTCCGHICYPCCTWPTIISKSASFDIQMWLFVSTWSAFVFVLQPIHSTLLCSDVISSACQLATDVIPANLINCIIASSAIISTYGRQWRCCESINIYGLHSLAKWQIDRISKSNAMRQKTWKRYWKYRWVFVAGFGEVCLGWAFWKCNSCRW